MFEMHMQEKPSFCFDFSVEKEENNFSSSIFSKASWTFILFISLVYLSFMLNYNSYLLPSHLMNSVNR